MTPDGKRNRLYRDRVMANSAPFHCDLFSSELAQVSLMTFQDIDILADG
jgi:hypothetical protein